jgi:alpha/beta superfamily hydrolase
LVIQGKDDDLVDAQAVRDWCAELKNPDYFEIEGADHFFHGKLGDLREIIQNWNLITESVTNN